VQLLGGIVGNYPVKPLADPLKVLIIRRHVIARFKTAKLTVPALRYLLVLFSMVISSEGEASLPDLRKETVICGRLIEIAAYPDGPFRTIELKAAEALLQEETDINTKERSSLNTAAMKSLIEALAPHSLITYRLPKGLHRDVAQIAARIGVTQEDLAVYAISRLLIIFENPDEKNRILLRRKEVPKHCQVSRFLNLPPNLAHAFRQVESQFDKHFERGRNGNALMWIAIEDFVALFNKIAPNP
jgi:hypothetical protein